MSLSPFSMARVRKPQKSIQVRMDEKLKNRAEKIFESLGLDTPTAIRIFFAKVVADEGIPFSLGWREEQYSKEQLAYLDRLAEEGMKPGGSFGPFDSADEMLAHMNKQDV
ncbi:MAG: type II toxin-antitoxin system RelB/DinJ family antitoxin [Patescibacteria group bacterium]